MLINALFPKRVKRWTALAGVFVFLVSLPIGTEAITIKAEEELSGKFLKALDRYLERVRDPEIVGYVNRVGRQILEALPPQPFKYRFYVVKDDAYNAFATPAGHIFVNTGLFAAMESEAELAGILGHEIAHVVCRHISDKIDRSQKTQVLTLAGLVASALIGAGGSAAAASAMSTSSLAAVVSVELAYSREDERQADQLGLEYLEKAGYGAEGLLAMLEKIRGQTWIGVDKIPVYMRTHPGTRERMAYIDTWIEEKQPGGRPEAPDNGFKRAHARVVALYTDADEALKRLTAAAAEQSDDPIAHYALGLVLARTGETAGAAEAFKAALHRNPFDPYILKEIGILQFNDGRYREALETLNGVSHTPARDETLLYFLGRSYLALDQYTAAAEALTEIERGEADYPQALYYLGETYYRQGRKAEAHYYLGRYYAGQHHFSNARFHLEKALALATDQERITQIQTLLNQVRKEGKQDSPSAKGG